MCSSSHKFLETSTFYHMPTNFYRHAIIQIYTDLLVIYQNFNTFAQETLYLSIIWKIIGTLHRKSFLKHPLFATFSLFWKVSEVCIISNKYWLSNKSANKIFLHKTPCTLLYFKQNFSLSIAEPFRNIHFLQHIYKSSQGIKCAIFQVKTKLLVI